MPFHFLKILFFNLKGRQTDRTASGWLTPKCLLCVCLARPKLAPMNRCCHRQLTKLSFKAYSSCPQLPADLPWSPSFGRSPGSPHYQETRKFGHCWWQSLCGLCFRLPRHPGLCCCCARPDHTLVSLFSLFQETFSSGS